MCFTVEMPKSSSAGTHCDGWSQLWQTFQGQRSCHLSKQTDLPQHLTDLCLCIAVRSAPPQRLKNIRWESQMKCIAYCNDAGMPQWQNALSFKSNFNLNWQYTVQNRWLTFRNNLMTREMPVSMWINDLNKWKETLFILVMFRLNV